MFPSEESPDKTVKKSPSDKKTIIILASVAGVCLLVVFCLLFATGMLGGSKVKIPASVSQKVQSPIYLPGKLPGKYEISNDSFNFVEQDKVLVFQASDGVGGNLIFSEQAKPKGFDFDSFHKGQFENAQTLSGTPYTSVWGKSGDGRLALSIVTKDTWILMATSAPLGQDDMVRIAAGIHKR